MTTIKGFIIPDAIEYTSNNGFTGRMYGKPSLVIFETASGLEVQQLERPAGTN